MPAKIIMLPIEDWKVARIIRFRFRYHICDCDGTIVYMRPFTTIYNSKTPDIIDNCIVGAINTSFSDVQTHNCEMEWEHSYPNLKQVYDGDRPKSQLTIRMTPSLDPDIMPKLVGQEIYAYDFKLNVYLDYIGDPKNIPSERFITHSFPYTDNKLFNKVVDEVTTL